MRLGMAVALCAVIAASGCAPKAPDEDAPFLTGISAFKTGDRAALTAALESLTPPTEPPRACSPEAMATARRAAMRRILEPLDHTAVLSMGEEARYIYFLGVSNRQVESVAWPRETCRDNKVLTLDDSLKRAAMMRTWQSSGKDWRDAMTDKYGRELGPRLNAARRTLHVNRLNPQAWDWQSH